MKKVLVIIGAVVLLLGGAAALYFLVFAKNLNGRIVVPYIAHQKPRIDPHVPAADPTSDKLDEVIFDGLFNVSANPSGITYEDGVGEYMGIDQNSLVTIRLKPARKWHSSWNISMEKEKVTITDKAVVAFTAEDLRFTLRRIQKLGSLSPDFILVAQAVKDFDFTGPDENGDIRLQFRTDRVWSETDVKEVLSFKILPANAALDAPEYKDGTGPYMLAGQFEDQIYFPRIPAATTGIPRMLLKPYIDNSTYTTEMKNRNINVLLGTPFGAVSPILGDTGAFFHKSNISTGFFALYYNTERLSRAQRQALRKLVDRRELMERFFKVNTAQQRHIADYRGNHDNYEDYLNYSMFPSTSYYIEEQVVTPLLTDTAPVDMGSLPDTVRIQTCLNYGYREELAELVDIMNDPTVFKGKIKVTAVQNEELARGNYDAVLVPVSGYRSNFLFDLYDILLREPDLAVHRVNLITAVGPEGKQIADDRSFEAAKNFFRLDLSKDSPEKADIRLLLDYVYAFMSTSEIGDKQAYAQRIDQLDQSMALGGWLFSLPSLAYFSTQFDAKTIDLYGVASQLSTIEKWQEKAKK